MVGMQGPLTGIGAHDLIARLGIETNKLDVEFDHLGDALKGLLKNIRDAFEPGADVLSGLGEKGPLAQTLSRTGQRSDAAAGSGGGHAARPASPLSDLGPGGGARLRALLQTTVVRLAYVAILKAAMDKATGTRLFNLETAINDLWVHLEELKRLQVAPQSGIGGGQVEFAKLQHLIQERSTMFDLLSRILKQYDDTAKSVINNMR